MKFFILILCLLLPFCLSYLIKNTEINWYAASLITIMFGLLVANYLLKNNQKNQYSLRSFIFKRKSDK